MDVLLAFSFGYFKLFRPPLGQQSRLKGFSFWQCPGAPGGDALGNLTLATRVKPRLADAGIFHLEQAPTF
jgi:hypothetical protein